MTSTYGPLQTAASALHSRSGHIPGLPGDAHDVVMARCITAMGNIMGFIVLVEGVESSAQRDFLLHNGCHQAQGYWFGAPMPATEITALLECSVAGQPRSRRGDQAGRQV